MPADRKPALRRGGARLKADRQTFHLTGQDCRKIIAGAKKAWRQGLPFNRFITGAWQRGGRDRAASVRATGEFVTLMRDWLRSQGYPLAWAWVQEWSATTGAHCHILVHVPPELDPLFKGKPRQWARKVLGGQYVPRVIQSKRLVLARLATLCPDAYQAELFGRLHYMLKCAPAELEVATGMIGWGHVPWGQSGLVFGKRAAVWQAADP